MFQRRILFLSCVIFVCAAGIYFRVYPLRYVGGQATKHSEKIASDVILKKITQQLNQSLLRQYPAMPSDQRSKLAEDQAKKLITDEPDKFKETLKNAVLQIEGGRIKDQKRPYLLEADPYLYYGLTKKIRDTGKIGPEVKNGRFYNPDRLAPKGVWSFMTWHPYLGFYFYQFCHFFKPGIDMMTTLGFFPLFLMIVMVVCFYFFGFSLRKGIFATTMGCLSLVLSPINLQRGAYGWYDTDPYNYIFPLLILALFFRGIENRKSAVWMGCLSGFFTGLYAYFWVGWPFIVGLIFAASVFSGFVSLILCRDKAKTSFLHGSIYLVASTAFLIIFMTPKGFYEALEDVLIFLPKVSSADYSIWPNVFVGIGETRSITLQKLMYLTGNMVTFGIAGFGIIAAFIYNVVRRRKNDFRQWLILFFILLPLLLLSLKTERFSLLFVMPVSFFVILGVEHFQKCFCWILSRIPVLKPHGYGIKIIAMILILLMALPMQFIFAHAVALGMEPIMNDAWYDVLTEINRKSPKESIVYSWWPPGHFITSVAERGVVTDGASQHLPECYWMAQFFMATDERQAVGILRMLYSSGSDAASYLQSIGFSLTQAIELLLKIVALDRAAALVDLQNIRPYFSWEHLLTLTHGVIPPGPAYVFLYNDMIEQNLALSVIANWNFDKAIAIKKEKKGFMNLLKGSNRDYIQDFVSASGEFLGYKPAASLDHEKDGILYFKNGLEVNRNTMEALVFIKDQKVFGKPASFFYMKDGQFVEIQNEGIMVNMSALLYDDHGRWMSVLAHRNLIRSMMFRLYYLKGQGLRYFEPWIDRQDETSKTNLCVFKVRWPDADEKAGKKT